MAIKQTQQGFVLLIAVIFMSVMLTFGLALGSLSYKQQLLAASALASQYAFYAADSALECALYADQQQNVFAYPATAPTSAPALSCGAGTAPVSATIVSYTGTEWITKSRLSLDNGKHCADVTVYKPNGAGTTYLFSQGYDASCDVVSNPAGARVASRGVQAHY
jgi:Tfp pilus assembly protein PilX